MTTMPILEGGRLRVRPLTLDDLDSIYRILDLELCDGETLEARRAWLEWTVLSYTQLARLHQPPYGERAVELKPGGELIGAAGLVPSFDAFELLLSFGDGKARPESCRSSPEVGLYYAISPAYQGRGFATQAARLLIEYAFTTMHVGRIIATTTYDNLASQAVMRHLGMCLERNPFPEPPWLQVVGSIER